MYILKNIIFTIILCCGLKPVFGQFDPNLDKGRADYNNIIKKQKEVKQEEDRKSKLNPEEELRKAQFAKEEQNRQRALFLQSEQTKKMMKEAKIKAMRFNNGESDLPFYKRWWKKVQKFFGK